MKSRKKTRVALSAWVGLAGRLFAACGGPAGDAEEGTATAGSSRKGSNQEGSAVEPEEEEFEIPGC